MHTCTHTHALTHLLASDKVTLCPSVAWREHGFVSTALCHVLYVPPDRHRSNEKSKAKRPRRRHGAFGPGEAKTNAGPKECYPYKIRNLEYMKIKNFWLLKNAMKRVKS